MTILIDIRDDSPGNWLPAFTEALPQERAIWAADASESDLASAEWVLVWSPDPQRMRAMTGLKAIFSMGAGVDHVFALGEALPNAPVVRFVDPDLTNRMSEWVVLQCLTHLRQVRAYQALQHAHMWRQLPQPAARDVTVGIMGMGVLGQDAAAKLAVMGFAVRGWSRTQKSLPGVEGFSGEDGLTAFLAGTDILVNLLPHTTDTHRMIGRRIFEGLRRTGPLGGPVFINAGRGRTHVETDIIEALRNGPLVGVSLDVFEREPLARESPLWDMERAILTPHVAAWSDSRAVARNVARQIARHRNGEAFENVAEAGRGY